ncbi:hypothetical protein [Variovorax sp. PAMC 28711]|uniref:hypothetical protein n=1 Tax=Variovorax sp. PAMC 28711 TaxID=1795631 RepID=UPI00078D6317|nr:hypothetical protein [Variovorax sp. PAMC 28711]AMM24811.1 hypothetical protein AX767_10935 [Variovorax sp. PAMC 28711]
MVDAKGIALVVNEPAPGRFFWELQTGEAPSGGPAAVDKARRAMPSYGLAMMAGMVALQCRRGRRGAASREFDESRIDFGPTTIQ